MAKMPQYIGMRFPLLAILAFGLSMPVAAENLVGTSVKLRALDKVTATTEDFTVNLGESLEYGSLRVDVKHCEKKPPEDIPETFAFLQIFEAQSDGKGTSAQQEKVFSGWMLASRPAISALDHPVYDIWVLGCNVPKVEPAADLTSDLDQSGTPKLRP